MTRRTPTRKKARIAEQQRRVQSALSYWEASLIQIESKPDEAAATRPEGAAPAEKRGNDSTPAEAPEGRSAHGGEEARQSDVFQDAMTTTGGMTNG